MSKKVTKNQLFKKRDHIYNQLTKFGEYIDSFDTSQSIFNLNARLKHAETLLNEFMDVHYELDAEDDAVLDQFQEDYYDAISRAHQILHNHKESPKNSAATTSANNTPNIILPQQHLPTFDGDLSRWNEFKDSFEALINDNATLVGSQKITYLKSCLKGNAFDIIASLSNTEANFGIAWKLLLSKYDNKRRILQNHVRAIIEAQSVGRESHLHLGALINTIQKNLGCLRALATPDQVFSVIFNQIVVSKLDLQTARDWEEKINNAPTDEVPTIDELMKFLQIKLNTLESLSVNKEPLPQYQSKNKTLTHLAVNPNCPYCQQQSHNIFRCSKFLKLNVADRIATIKELGLCLNCLYRGHTYTDCRSSFCCKICQKRHNTLLHLPNSQDLRRSPSENNTDQSYNANPFLPRSESKQATSQFTHCGTSYFCTENYHQTLLSTVCIQVFDRTGTPHIARALLDSGSQSNYITQTFFDKLQVDRSDLNMKVTGITGQSFPIKHKTQINISSHCSNFSSQICCLIIPKITGDLPQFSFRKESVNMPRNIQLADPTYNESRPIDILLGATLFWDVLRAGQIRLGSEQPILQETCLGWLISGTLQCRTDSMYSNYSLFAAETLHEDVEKFWQIDEFLQKEKMLTDDESFCENHFVSNISRDNSGRFIVRLPFNLKVSALGKSYSTALKRFSFLENKFKRDSNYQTQYNQVINEYLSLNHMSEFNYDSSDETLCVFLPHHGVIKETSSTTRLRVVFDGSCKTDSGVSLNEALTVGPCVQSDLFAILTRFRLYQYVLVGDLEKMYRQVLVHPEDRKYQCIVYREHSDKPIQHFRLNTVTFGTASAPFLATRCLNQIANDIQESYPIESKIIKSDCYVDDIITGANELLELHSIKSNLVNIFNSYGFCLRKFSSNINNNIETDIQSIFSLDTTKILGVSWCPRTDQIFYKTSDIPNSDLITKRVILSSTSKLFDPLGLIAPVIVRPKILIQSLWQLKLDWDDPVPNLYITDWTQYKSELNLLDQIRINRLVIPSQIEIIELHIFADASESAYGACAYIRSINAMESISVSLIAAKSRVAPIRKTTIPRLELCAAVIAAQLLEKLKTIMNVPFTSISLWSDSSIVLSWLKKSPATWNTYVANRVAEIQRLSKGSDWHHIPTQENPADLVSRGCTPSELIASKLWWSGPSFFESQFDIEQFKPEFKIENVPELKTTTVLAVQTEETFQLFDRFSCLKTLVRVTSHCLRFFNNIKNPTLKISGPITSNEFDQTLNKLIKLVQNQIFKAEISCLKKSQAISSRSSIYQLGAFLNSDNFLCVGGRLHNADIPEYQKHQILLPSNHKLTELIINYEHVRTMHTAPLALLNAIRQKYWPLKARSLIKKICNSCVRCFRANPRSVQPYMGNLPNIRVCPAPPFFHTGVDFAGPFNLRENRKRKYQISKCYIGLFVCMATKAIHLELVTDLSTDCFISALRRFVSRRGVPKTVTSDNGTNFVGAANELRQLQEYFRTNHSNLASQVVQLGIEWKFIPPRAPNFGGIWEAGVKSVKTHLKRVISDTILTFESFYTVLLQIEAVLNSRPISPLSDSPYDLNPLTPAHFIIGRPLTNIPNKRDDYSDVPSNRLSKYELFQAMVQSFWSRWSREYLHTLQQRSKWNKHSSDIIKVGALALIIEDNLPPMVWKLGRIISLHPGNDGVVRVATLKVQVGELKRSVSKLCVLPIET